jgi:hypothetical protein
MSSKRRLRRRECGNKIKYPSADEARFTAYKLSDRYKDDRLSFYKCLWCGKWDLGHKPQEGNGRRRGFGNRRAKATA